MFRPVIILLLFTIVQLLSVNYAIAQRVATTQTFARFVSSPIKATVVRLKPNGIKVPKGGHLQGIQCLNDSTLIITASSGSYSYYLSATFNALTGKGHLTGIHKITDGRLRHAGGCQVYGQTLAVGVEDNIAKNKSEILLIDLDEKGNETSRRIIAHRQGEFKRSTAGAVGFIKIKTGQFMVVVGDWDSKNLDVYLSKPGQDLTFDSVATLHITDLKNVPSYQAINLLYDSLQGIYLSGFALDGTRNRADLFKIDLNQREAKIKTIGTSTYKCKGGAGFRFASGVKTASKREFRIYTAGRGTLPKTVVNIF
jgi:hypothetical protein